MKTYDITDKEGRLLAFEVENLFLMRRDVGNAFKSVPGMKVTKPASPYGDEFCECELNGKRFVAWEPYGDNSRFWIGPSPPEWNPDIEILRSAFAGFRPFWGILRGLCFLALLAGMIFQVLRD